jgi:hypothetical protein
MGGTNPIWADRSLSAGTGYTQIRRTAQFPVENGKPVSVQDFGKQPSHQGFLQAVAGSNPVSPTQVEKAVPIGALFYLMAGWSGGVPAAPVPAHCAPCDSTSRATAM